MQWFILSRDMHVLAMPSTDAPKSLPIFNDKQMVSITNNTVVSTYDFSVQQKHPDAGTLQMGNYIAFRDKYNKMKLYTLVSYDGDDLIQTWHAEDIGLDLLNETADKWDYTGKPHDIVWYLDNLILKDTGWSIGFNEVGNLTRALKFEGQSDTLLKRLGDVANQFDGAEIDFTIEMESNRVTRQVINIHKKIGSPLIQDRYIDSVNLKSLKTSGSIANLCTSMIGYGSQLDPAEGQDASDLPPIDFSNISYDDGQFYSPVGDKHLYDRVSHLQWSRFKAFNYANQGEFDGYINGIYTYDTKDPQELLNRTLAELKKRNHAEQIYEADLLSIEADVGDYVQIAHNNYNPPIYLQARIESVTNCYMAKGQDTGILGDYTLLEPDIDPRVKDMLDALKNQIKGNYTWIRYAKDDKGTGMTATPTADTKYVAIIGNKPTAVPSDDPTDYAGHWQLIQGQDGADGIPGAKGEDGKTSYTHFAYADNVSGTKDFSTTDPTGRSYMGVYSDFTKADSINPGDYVWSYTKGETGPVGRDGAQGIPGRPGADGKTPYTHVAYANNDVGGGFSQSPDNKAYMGWYSDFTQADSTDVTKYAWSLIKGADGKDGVAGKDGLGIKSTIIAYQLSSSGTTTPTGAWSTTVPALAKGQYLWTRTTLTYTDNSSEPVYSVSYVAKDGNNGSDGVAGKDGVGIKSTTITYQSGTSGTVQPTGTWVSNPPSVTGSNYLWTRTIWSYTDGTNETGYSVAKAGDMGQSVWSYLYNRGANRLGSYWSDLKPTPTTAKPPKVGDTIIDLIGNMYQITNVVVGTAEQGGGTFDYGSLITSIKGSDGATGAPGKPGADGRTPYFHQAWADSKDGKTNFSTTDPTNRGYLGTYTDFTQADSTDPTKYYWVELVGNLQVGVRNLLKGTADFSNGLNLSGANGTVITDEVYNGNRVLKEPQLTASNSYHDPYVSNTIDVAKGEYYALSFYAKTDAPSMVMRCYFFNPTNTISSINNQGFQTTSSDGLSTFTITNQWKQYWIVWRTNINTTVKRVIIGRREKPLAGSDTGSIFINSPMLVEGNKAVGWQAAPEDTQQQIDTINQGLVDTNSKIAAVTKVDSQATAPTNPKKGDQWWVKDANGNINAFKIWDGTQWADSIIQQSAMNISTLNGNIINGATINSSNFNVSYDETRENSGRPFGPYFKGTQVIKNGSYLSDFQVKGSTQTGYSHITPDGITTRINDNNGKLQSQASLVRGAIELEDQHYSGYLEPGDVERTNREVWTTYAGEDGEQIMGLSKQFRRVWFDGTLFIPQGQWNGNIGNYNKVLQIKDRKLYPKSNKIIGVTTLGNNSETASIQIQPDGWIVVVWSSRAQRVLVEGCFYTLDF